MSFAKVYDIARSTPTFHFNRSESFFPPDCGWRGAANRAPRIFTNNQRNPMKPVIRYQSQLLYRRSYKPSRILRIKPTAKLRFSFRPVRFGVKPQIKVADG
jgi:hypothetical protein